MAVDRAVDLWFWFYCIKEDGGFVSHIYLWVLKTKTKSSKDIWGTPVFGYYARRTSLKNPRFITPFTSYIKLFENKNKAEEYLTQKIRKHPSASKLVPVRYKLYLNDEGSLDYWKNSYAFDRRQYK